MAATTGQRKPAETERDTPLHERLIVERLLCAILEQRLAPGAKLSEAALCDAFGVGRMHVRRALLLLASRGVVELHPNRGAFIARPDLKDARNVFEARLMLEPAIAEKVAREATAADLKLLRDHIERERQARTRRSRSDLIRLSGEFHLRLAEASANVILARTIRDLVTQSSLIIGLFATNIASACPEDEHLAILEAISAGDGPGAGALMRTHFEHIEADLDLTPSPVGSAARLAQIIAGKAP